RMPGHRAGVGQGAAVHPHRRQRAGGGAGPGAGGASDLPGRGPARRRLPRPERTHADEPVLEGAARRRGAVGGARRGLLVTREWVSFDDPAERRTWVFDVTFLLSRWTCIYGRGCQGVLTGPAEDLVQGCCSYGAHFTGEQDVARVEEAAATLTDDD